MFSNFPECDSEYVLALFAIGILLLFPYGFVGVQILRNQKLSNLVANDHSISFCFITIYTNFVIIILHLSNLSLFKKENDVYIYRSARYFQLFAVTLVFIDVTKVLLTLDFRGAKILLYIGRITEIIIGILVFVHFIAFYIPYSKFTIHIVKKIQAMHTLTGLTLYLVSLFVIVLSFCFIFTNLQHFIDTKRLFMIRLGIFILFLLIVLHSNTYFWIKSKPFQYHLMRDLSNLKFYDQSIKTNIKFEVLNLAYLCLWDPLCCYVFFLTMYYLSPDVSPENVSETPEVKIEFASLFKTLSI